MNTKHGITAEKAIQMWKTDLDNPVVHRDVEDGETVIAVRRPTTIDSEKARSREIQRVEEGDAATLRSKLKQVEQYDSEFADVGGDVLRQGASSSRIQVRVVEMLPVQFGWPCRVRNVYWHIAQITCTTNKIERVCSHMHTYWLPQFSKPSQHHKKGTSFGVCCR